MQAGQASSGLPCSRAWRVHALTCNWATREKCAQAHPDSIHTHPPTRSLIVSKYLFIATNEWQWGGSEMLWSGTAERLAARGEQVGVSIQELGKPREPLER